MKSAEFVRHNGDHAKEKKKDSHLQASMKMKRGLYNEAIGVSRIILRSNKFLFDLFFLDSDWYDRQ
jgi:hypothetical protein